MLQVFLYIYTCKIAAVLKDKDKKGEHKTRFAGSFIERCLRDSLCLYLCISKYAFKESKLSNMHTQRYTDTGLLSTQNELKVRSQSATESEFQNGPS